MTPNTPDSKSRTPRFAFSIIELIMVMGVIVILISLVIVGLRGMQRASARTESVNALRQMVAGYIGYTMDNRDRLMPGYIDYSAMDPPNIPLNARLATGEWLVPQNAPLGDRENLSSYVWRLMPYLQHDWRVVTTDYRDRGVMRHFESQVNSKIYGPGDLPFAEADTTPTLATWPAYGLNSIFLGGDSRHGGSVAESYSPWTTYPNPNPLAKSFVATRATEVLRPTELIVFAPAARIHPGWLPQVPTSPIYYEPAMFNQPGGYAELRPPFIEKVDDEWTKAGRQWHVKEFGGVHPFKPFAGTNPFGKGAGIPIMRHGSGYLPVAHFDGSAIIADILPVSVDMRRWCPFEIGELPAIDPTQWPE